jgi:hypothetical protein
MSGLSSALVAIAFTSVAWLAKGGAVLGGLVGGVLAYAAIARVIRAQGAAPQRVTARRFATLCCLLWGLLLPIPLGTAGLLWGLARGLGNVVEGPVSTTVRATAHTWLNRASGLRAGVLGRYPLAKRLSDGELMVVVHAAPEWFSEVLGHDELAAAWQKINGVPVPPQVLSFVREEFRAVTGDRMVWLRSAVDRLRSRAQGAAADRPTLQETIEAMVAPSVFQDAATAIRATAGHYIRMIVLGVLGLSALLAGVLRLLWKAPAAAAAATTTATKVDADAPPRESAHG